MKRKKWYELLDNYNELAALDQYNNIMADTEQFSRVKESIKTQLEKMYTLAEAEIQAKLLQYEKMGYNPAYAKTEIEKSRIAKWAKKADNIIAAINAEQTISEEDMKGSFIEPLWFGIFNTTQTLIILAVLMIIFLLTR